MMLTRFRLLPFLVFPLLCFAHDNGGPAGRTGVEGETTCLSCHRGIRLNAGGGNVVVTFPGSFTYTPGIPQRLRVTVTDTANAGLGFQVTARREDSPQVMAGGFSIPAAAAGNGRGQAGSTVARSHVTCWNGDVDVDDTPKPASGCPSSAPIESVTHSLPIDAITGTWEFDFVPPSTNVGPIRIYAAGNAVQGPEENNSRVYTSSYLLNALDGVKPEISAITPDSNFGEGTRFSPGTWVQIAGFDLAATLRGSSDYDFTGSVAPTSMDGVQVLAGGKPAFLSSVQPRLLRALLPDVPAGSTSLTVKVGNMVSAELKIDIATASPYVAVLNQNGKNYARAQFANGGFVTPVFQGGPGGQGGPGVPPGGPGIPGGPGGGGFQLRQAAAGDALTIQAIGLGPTTPAVPIGTKALANADVPNVTVKLGEKSATVTAARLVEGSVGIYQISFTVPDGLGAGEVAMVVSVNGIASTQNVLLPTR